MRDVHQAVIMVGGLGTRLRPLTNTCPKIILPILDKPCLEYFIDTLIAGGITDIIMACGYRSAQVTEAIGDGTKQGIRITYSYEDTPMGTGGAMKLIENRLDETFVAVNGDVFEQIDVRKEIEEHCASGAAVTISLKSVENPCEYGIVRVDDTGKITEFKEKPRPEEVFSDLINSGIYVVNRDVLRYVPAGEKYDFSKELIPELVKRGYRIQGYRNPGSFRDIGRPSDLLGANLEMAGQRFSEADWSSNVKSTELSGRIFFGKGTSVSDSKLNDAVILDNCSISKCDIGNSLVLSDCTINQATIIDSIIGKGCTIGPGAHIERSVLGDGTAIGRDRTVRDERGV